MNKTKYADSALKMTSSQYDEIVLLIFIPKKRIHRVSTLYAKHQNFDGR